MKTPHVLLLVVALLGGGLLARPSRAQSFQARALLTPEQVEILSHMSLVNLDDGTGTPRRTLRITGLNVQIVNGEGGTETTDGLGNLILGYNETGAAAGDERTGSHNLVLGVRGSYTSHGGILAGRENRIEAPFAAVLAGHLNRATGRATAVVGGQQNEAQGEYSVVAGGCDNRTFGFTSKICGGIFNETRGADSCISGGVSNLIHSANQASSICGGRENVVEDFASSATVSGGFGRTALGNDDWIAGSLFEDD